MTTLIEIGNTISGIVTTYWAEHNAPLLLSNLSPLLTEKIPDYKTVIPGKSLKTFITESGPQHGYKLVEHPAQPAKIGILPKESEFSFPYEGKTEQDKDNSNIEKTVIEFLRELKKLPQEDIDKIQIPLYVLVKLIK